MSCLELGGHPRGGRDIFRKLIDEWCCSIFVMSRPVFMNHSRSEKLQELKDLVKSKFEDTQNYFKVDKSIYHRKTYHDHIWLLSQALWTTHARNTTSWKEARHLPSSSRRMLRQDLRQTLLPLCQWKARAQPFLHQVTLLRPLSNLDHRGIKHAQIDGWMDGWMEIDR